MSIINQNAAANHASKVIACFAIIICCMLNQNVYGGIGGAAIMAWLCIMVYFIVYAIVSVLLFGCAGPANLLIALIFCWWCFTSSHGLLGAGGKAGQEQWFLDHHITMGGSSPMEDLQLIEGEAEDKAINNALEDGDLHADSNPAAGIDAAFDDMKEWFSNHNYPTDQPDSDLSDRWYRLFSH